MFINTLLKRMLLCCVIHLSKCFIVSDLRKQTINVISLAQTTKAEYEAGLRETRQTFCCHRLMHLLPLSSGLPSQQKVSI